MLGTPFLQILSTPLCSTKPNVIVVVSDSEEEGEVKMEPEQRGDLRRDLQGVRAFGTDGEKPLADPICHSPYMFHTLSQEHQNAIT